MPKAKTTRLLRSTAWAVLVALGSTTWAVAQVSTDEAAVAPPTTQPTEAATAQPTATDASLTAPPATSDSTVAGEPVRPQADPRDTPAGLAAPDSGPTDFLSDPPSRDQDPRPVADNLLMRALGGDRADSPLHESGLVVSGYVQGGYTYNPARSSGDVIFGRVFDDEFANAPQLDQVELSLARVARRDRFDVGGRLEVIYGYDTFRLHSNGLDMYGGCDDDAPNPDNAAHDPRNQLDLTQAYLDVNFEVGTGLLLRLGKFVTPLGYETIDPTTTPFYSRSYLFGFAKPFTNTGALLNYRFDDHWEAWGGVVRGWDQSLKDTNDSVSFLGRLDYHPNARWDFRVGVITGREGAECDCGCPGNDETRTLVDFIATHALTERLSLGIEALYGVGTRADENGGAAEWYGAAGYASYAICPMAQLNARAEWFSDRDGTRLQTGQDLEVTSLTLGLAIKPFESHAKLNGLRIQPEIRYDHATTPEFDGGTNHDQFTLGLGVLYAF